MKVLQINTVYPNGSTGKIVQGIYEQCKNENIECRVAYRYFENNTYEDTVEISSWLDCHIHNRLVKWTNLQGCFSHNKTKKFIKWIDSYNPDIIHLHNIHGNYLNFKMLFDYIKKRRIKAIMTMHDCWAMTGLCAHFSMAKCEKWRSGCYDCQYVCGLFGKRIDIAKYLYDRKTEYFSNISDFHIIANSNWTASLARQSFLKKYPIDVIYNGIDLSVFKPTDSSFRNKYCIGDDAFIILGVAFDWGKRKGLDVFITLSELLNKGNYKIVLVGTTDDIDKLLPETIISIHKTHDQKELAAIYSAANVFVNPTREEALGMVNIEANACGTPVVTFNTGGCPECISDQSGCVVPYNDIDELKRAIMEVCETKKYSVENCVKNAQRFDMRDKYSEYTAFYKRIVNV